MPDLYAILEVQPSAEPAAIQAAYRRLARRYHPDVNGAPDATARMRSLNAAYETLGDPARRAAYDRARRPPTWDTPFAGSTAGPAWTSPSWPTGFHPYAQTATRKRSAAASSRTRAQHSGGIPGTIGAGVTISLFMLLAVFAAILVVGVLFFGLIAAVIASVYLSWRARHYSYR